MKKLAYTIALTALSICAVQAQEKIEKTTKIRTTVKSSLGNETVYKTVKETQVTPVSLDETDAGELNQSLKRGETIIKREVTYTYNDSNFTLEESANGYKIMRTHEDNTTEFGTMRKLAKGDVYVMNTTDGISVSYFDDDGNMVSEKYSDKDDSVTTITYSVKESPEMK